jgi:holo-[acyl-carrier protein] synthase
MIVGIGADLLQLKRLEAAYDRTKGRLAKRVLGDEELIVFEQRLKRNHKRGIAYLATRFAAKEAGGPYRLSMSLTVNRIPSTREHWQTL